MRNFGITTKADNSLFVLVWPDGTWALEEEYAEYTHMSDDFQRINLYDHTECGLVDDKIWNEIVDEIMGD